MIPNPGVLALARRLVSYRISIALGAAVIAGAITWLSGALWAAGYFYVFCDFLCSIAAIWVNRADGIKSVLAHVAVTVVWLCGLFITLPALVMRVWPP